jgi:hypothetical protein
LRLARFPGDDERAIMHQLLAGDDDSLAAR